MLASFFMLLLGRINIEDHATETLGKIVVEGCVVAIGVSIGTAQLGENPESDQRKGKPISFLGQLTIALCGAVIIGANIAPTEEILMIAVESSPKMLLGLLAFSMLLATVTLRLSGFRGAKELTDGYPVHPTLFSSVVSLAIALTASAYMLWFFGRFEGMAIYVSLAMVVVLGLPSVLGATVGRLLLQL